MKKGIYFHKLFLFWDPTNIYITKNEDNFSYRSVRMLRKNKLKYSKPILKEHGNLKKVTHAGQDGTGDYAGKYGES